MEIRNDKIDQIDAKIAKFEKQRKLEVRKEKKRQTREQNRRDLFIGRLVRTYFPELSEIELGKTKAKNTENFKPFEDFLKVISFDEKLKNELSNLLCQKNNIFPVIRKSDRYGKYHNV